MNAVEAISILKPDDHKIQHSLSISDCVLCSISFDESLTNSYCWVFHVFFFHLSIRNSLQTAINRFHKQYNYCCAIYKHSVWAQGPVNKFYMIKSRSRMLGIKYVYTVSRCVRISDPQPSRSWPWSYKPVSYFYLIAAF